MIPILNEAMAGNLGVIVFHSHPHEGRVAMSGDDRESAATLLPTFENLVATRPHASVVVGQDHAAGLALVPGRDGLVADVKVRWLGKVIQDFTDAPESELVAMPSVDESHHRQALLTGSAGERKLRKARIAVVGLSGGGSHVVQQLAHLGVGQIVGVDPDRADRSNRSRLIGMSALDAVLRRRKTRLMARMVRRINRRVKFFGVPHSLPSQESIDALKECDVIVGCVDNYHARSDLQELTWRYLIPYVDIGLLIQPLPGGGLTIGGHVATFIPGGFCQWCLDFLTEAKLAGETGGRPRSYFQDTDKQAQVVSMNGVLASQAVSEVLQLLTGFAPVDDEMAVKKFDGLEGTLKEWKVRPRNHCPICRRVLGAGDVVWQPA